MRMLRTILRSRSLRTKFILLLVSISLIPFILFYAFNIMSFRKVSREIKASISSTSRENAKNSIISMIEDFEKRRALMDARPDMSIESQLESEIIRTFRLPGQWGSGSDFLFVTPEQDTLKPALRIIARHNQQDSNDKLHVITSKQLPELEVIVQQARAGVNVRKTVFQGRDVLLGHGSLGTVSRLLLVIVPYELIENRSKEAQQILFTDYAAKGRYLLISVMLIIILVTALAIYRTQRIIDPIMQLTRAGKKLANGDFDVKVEINTRDEIEQLAGVFNSIGPKLKDREKIKASLELAKSIQLNLLPKTNPSMSSFDVAGACKYCDETGGDYYDFITYDSDDKKMGIVLGDVSGHGIGAALLMATARSILRNASHYYQGDLNKILFELNNQLINDSGDDKFITLFYGILDDNNKTLTWASGGHDPAILYRKKTNAFEELPNTGMAIGLLDNVTFETSGPVNLEQGDIVVIGTDGIWESQNLSGEFLGKDRLREIVENNSGRTALEICDLVIREAMEFCDKQADDITLIVVKTL